MPERVTEHNLLSKALREVSTGMYVVTAHKPADQRPFEASEAMAAGLVCWAVQISFEPPLLMVALQKDSNLERTVSQSGYFALNVLAKGQYNDLPDFAKDSHFTHDHINGHPYRLGTHSGCPVLDNALAYLECRVQESKQPGDHVLFMGEVLHGEPRREEPPLMEWETEYRYGG